MFYAGHRALHSRALWPLHRRHHEHATTALATNYHFHPLDLFVEAYVPVLAGLLATSAVGLKPTSFEIMLVVAHVFWYEIGSHGGKEVPTVTWFPPLAPLYTAALGYSPDAHNVWHHERHHNLVSCNYGITQWPDMLMATRKVASTG